jgi:hypothetical protein
VRLAQIQALPEHGFALDVETYRIQAGLTAPPLVLGSTAWLEMNEAGQLHIAGELLTKQRVGELLCMLLDDTSKVITGANISYDLLVIALYLAACGVDAMPAIYAALMDEGRVFDIQICEMLDAVAEACLGKDPRSGGPLMSPDTGRRAGYSLAVVTDLVQGRTDAKALGHVATEYGQYDDVPLEQLPPEMQAYPVDDSRNTHGNALCQGGHTPRAGAHRWGAQTTCEWCGVHPKEAYVDGQYVPCRSLRRSRNIHDLANQVGTAWAMHLGASYGFHVNQDSVTAVEDDALDGRAEAEQPFVERGLLKRNRDGSTSRDMSAICRAVALAYGADLARPCPTCSGTRKVISPKAKQVKCPLCRGGAESAGWTTACPKCAGAKTIPDPKQLINCTACGATGLDLDAAPHLPKTDTGRVGTGRDVLNESGDELLMSLADHQEDSKTLEVYIPYLRRARMPGGGHLVACPTWADDKNDCSCPGPFADIPLTLWPNVLLETGRTSYRGVIQLFPRKPGHWADPETKTKWVPSLRECIESRPGMVFSSEDYEAGELVTHAQSCLWICGESKLAEALIGGMKVHNLLGAQMMGMSYDEFQKIVGDPSHPRYQACKDARQAAKPGNFGFPGGMGPVKMVLQQRKQGPDTPHPSGPTWVKDDDFDKTGKPVRGYKGLRFCILMDGASSCGADKVTEWPPRTASSRREPQPIAPTCRRCIECAVRLKQAWLAQWPENEEYFKYINDCCENGQLITAGHLQMWPHLADFFAAGKRLAPGEIMQHVSGRVRGGVDYCSAANGFFQGLLADAAKSALRRISRECYDRTVVVKERYHENSRPSAYAGGPSPLFGHRPIVFAHDEIILEHPAGAAAHHGAMRVSEIMVEELMWYCPDMVKACAAEPTLMSRWYKGATPVWKVGGKKRSGPDDILVPWEPKK